METPKEQIDGQNNQNENMIYLNIISDVKRILEKYNPKRTGITGKVTKNPVLERRLQTFHSIYKPLVDQYKKDGGDKKKILNEMKLISEELFDALTRSEGSRDLRRPNRLDTAAETKKVQKLQKERFARIREYRKQSEQALERGEQKWKEKHLEIPYRLICSGGQGSNYTINSSTQKIISNVRTLEDADIGRESSRITRLREHIQEQLKHNNNLTDDTKKLLKDLEFELQ